MSLSLIESSPESGMLARMLRICRWPLGKTWGRLGLLLVVSCATLSDTSGQESGGEPRAPTNLQLFLVLGLPNLPPRGRVREIDRQLPERARVMTKEFGWSRSINDSDWTAQELTNLELAITFSHAVAEARPDATLGLIPAAFGGTRLDDWMPSTSLYRGAVERARIAMKDGKLVGILWHQGPTGEDPAQAKAYAKRFASLIAQLRTDLGVKYVPVIVGELQLAKPGKSLATPLSEVPQQVIPCFFISAEGLQSDRTHLDSDVLWNFSERFARGWMDLAQP